VPGGIGIGHGFLQGIVVAYGNNRTGAHPLALCAARSARHTATSLPQAQLFDLPSPTGMKRARRMASAKWAILGACADSSATDRRLDGPASIAAGRGRHGLGAPVSPTGPPPMLVVDEPFRMRGSVLVGAGARPWSSARPRRWAFPRAWRASTSRAFPLGPGGDRPHGCLRRDDGWRSVNATRADGTESAWHPSRGYDPG
jgi:hypothetical protein